MIHATSGTDIDQVKIKGANELTKAKCAPEKIQHAHGGPCVESDMAAFITD
jgi:hypothetical protein